jgi:hypothetical protein
LDPEIPLFSIFSPSFYRNTEKFRHVSSTASVSRQPSLSRGGVSITSLLHRIRNILLRPFTLAPAATTHYHQPLSTTGNGVPTFIPERVQEAVIEAHVSFRDPSQPTYLSNAMKSDTDTLSLPFKLNIRQVHDKTNRNLPYLRQSWGRIDFVAIVSFWITFALAMFELERGKYHIGVFRAMSVIRCARLLAITSGTTVSMNISNVHISEHHFLVDHYAFLEDGEAAPCQHCILCLVRHDIILVSRRCNGKGFPSNLSASIIGVQAFRGSLRRACWLQPTLGENEIQLNQFCGGHINSTLQVSGFVKGDGTIAPTAKGFICPLGQLCKVGCVPWIFPTITARTAGNNEPL